MKKVEIFSTPACHYCQLAKEFFKENNIEFTDHDVVENADKRMELVEKSGQMGVPVILIGDQVIVGFNEEKLRELLSI